MTTEAGESGGTASVATVRVELGARSYDILVGEGLIATAGRHLAPLLKRPRAVTVTDAVVADLHLPALERDLATAGVANERIILPAGEATKDFDKLAALMDALLDLRIDRGTVLLALGGGVIGDIAGFAASIALRGIDFAQIPTTLLAQVDSSVGGKTGINTRHGKNLVGSFHQPRLVLADTGSLATLPRRELLAGYAEVAKYGLINDSDFFTWLEDAADRVLGGDAAAVRRAVVTSCEAKAAIVAADEREASERALLNLGHTFAHAFEAEAGYGGDLLHGEAVAIGMTMAFDLSARLGLCPATDATRVRRHLAAVGLPTDPPRPAPSPDALIARMRQDKKASDGRIAFVLVRGVGQAFIARDVPIEPVRALLAEATAD